MSIGILKFKLPEEIEEFETAQKAEAMASAIFDISNEVFRPARKHGYSDEAIQKLIEKIGHEDAHELISLLEEIYNGILSEYEVKV